MSWVSYQQLSIKKNKCRLVAIQTTRYSISYKKKNTVLCVLQPEIKIIANKYGKNTKSDGKMRTKNQKKKKRKVEPSKLCCKHTWLVYYFYWFVLFEMKKMESFKIPDMLRTRKFCYVAFGCDVKCIVIIIQKLKIRWG
jgi:hypothetical protein